LPVEPSFAKMIMASVEYGCTQDIISIAAMLSIQSVFVYPKERGPSESIRLKFAVHEGDHLTLLNVFNAFLEKGQSAGFCNDNFLNYKALTRAVEIRLQLQAYCKRFKLVPTKNNQGDSDSIRKSIVSGFFANAAHLQSDGSYLTVRDRHPLYLHPSSVVFKHPPDWVVFHEVMLTTKEYMRDVTAIDPLWLSEIAPHFYVYKHTNAQ